MDHFAAIAALLEENGLDAMLLTEEANRFYATGFHSIGTDGCALVCRGKNYYFTDSRYTEAAARHVKNAELGEVGRGRDYAVLLNEVIEKEGLRRVGFDDAYMTVRDCEKYREKLHAELVPASDLLGSLRRVKDAEEIESMIAAQRIAETARTDIFNEIQPGVTRTVAVGSETGEMKTVYETVLKAQLAGIAKAKAGVTGRDIDAAARKVIEDAGYGKYFGHSFGHSLGVEIHEAPNAAPMNDQPMPRGAVISAEPGIYLPGKLGVRIEDVIILGEDGCEDITLAPKELIIL